MFIPTGGFGWVTGNRVTAPSDQSECLLVMTLAHERDVDGLVDRARGVGGEIVMEPAEQPWGFSAVFADPDGHLWQVRSYTPRVRSPIANEAEQPTQNDVPMAEPWVLSVIATPD